MQSSVYQQQRLGRCSFLPAPFTFITTSNLTLSSALMQEYLWLCMCIYLFIHLPVPTQCTDWYTTATDTASSFCKDFFSNSQNSIYRFMQFESKQRFFALYSTDLQNCNQIAAVKIQHISGRSFHLGMYFIPEVLVIRSLKNFPYLKCYLIQKLVNKYSNWWA